MSIIDPTNHVMSTDFLLSEFIGCDSVYRHGYANPIYTSDTDKIKEGYNLVHTLGSITDQQGPITISYGYISPELSRKIIKYQNPDKPSYHRWDQGAAADFTVHGWEGSPIELAEHIDDLNYYSRMITYSESPYICLAFRTSEDFSTVMSNGILIRKDSNFRCALYENRYMGPGIKPKHIKYPMGENGEIQRARKLKEVVLEHDWVGAGYPTYHGGGRQQYHHIRVSPTTMVSDYLYAKALVHNGVANRPPNKKSEMYHWMQKAKQAASVYEQICNQFQTEANRRFPITAAYNCTNEVANWKQRFTLEVAFPDQHTIDVLTIKDYAREMQFVDKAWIVDEEVTKLRILGIRT